MIDIISLGAGVQSSTMALMAAHGEIEPMPAMAIFADTGWEPKAVYEWLDWLETQLPYPVVRVAKGNIREENLRARVRGRREDGERWASLPYFVDTGAAREGRIRRQCTSEYKIVPIENYIKREVLGIPKGKRLPKDPVVRQWRGISVDEIQRMKPSQVKWSEVRYPLVMEHGMTRGDCIAWMQRNGYPEPPRSACIGCFSAETEVITPDGLKPIGSLQGRPMLLVPHNGKGASLASFKEVEVRSFGIQELIEINLRRGRAEKTVFATKEHRWITRTKDGYWSKDFCTTADLRQGDILPMSKRVRFDASHHPVSLCPFGIARGFVFGDGSRPETRPHGAAHINFYEGKDEVMLQYFPLHEKTRYTGTHGEKFYRIHGLPRHWKDAPELAETRGYLAGWLAGYFAADGHITKNGQASISSARFEHLSYVRDLCHILGIGCGKVRSKEHPAKGGIATIHEINIDARDLPSDFWIMPHHCDRVDLRKRKTAQRNLGWIVHSIKPTDRVEEVFCAVVPDREMFVLADNIATGNCPFHSNYEWRTMKQERPEEFADAVAFDAAIRNAGGMRGQSYLHRSLKPLDQANLGDDSQIDLFGNECEGMCGV